MAPGRTGLRDAYRALDAASSWAEWHDAAEAHDALTGADLWRADDTSVHYDANALKDSIRRWSDLRRGGEARALADALAHDLQRHLADVSAPELYAVALGGTKHLVGRLLDEAEASLRWLAETDLPEIPAQEKLRRFETAWGVFGHSALLLSGGATWGFHHLGVAKALFEQGLLPHILSGASTGAMIAAGICTRDDAELAALFADPSALRLDGLAPIGIAGTVRSHALLDPDQLYAVLRHNVGDRTFAEAYAHSGRALAISVSPTRTRQKPRLLDHLTAPDVLIARAALASSALPTLFPPVQLLARATDGTTVPWLPGERWVDGSLHGDLPKRRLTRLHNVNHFIVSQTNPHVLPFVRHHGRRGLWPALLGIATATARTHGVYAADLARRASRGPARHLADSAYALLTQDYRGDIDLHPQFHWRLLQKVVANPTADDLAAFVREGERAVWPKLAMIRDQTRLGRTFRACVATLRQAVADAPTARPGPGEPASLRPSPTRGHETAHRALG